MSTYRQLVDHIAEKGNLRILPEEAPAGLVDLSSNDYLGLGADHRLMDEFLSETHGAEAMLTSSASRLLAAVQSPYKALEQRLGELYQSAGVVLFNSGYHANSGLIPSLAVSGTHIIADRLVHASIIDGIRLSGVSFNRSRHNDAADMERLARKALEGGAARVILIAESIYSMDGDRGCVEEMIDIKQRLGQERVMLYIDEAHAIGVLGPQGLGLVASSSRAREVDVVVGTFGKALASMGAFASFSDGDVAQWVVNTTRSLIFSTALPPLNAAWTLKALNHSLSMDSAREHLYTLAARLTDGIASVTGHLTPPSHIVPIIVGDASRAVLLSRRLAERGFKVLPIRTPTVPPGTERLRVSLSANLSTVDIDRFTTTINELI